MHVPSVFIDTCVFKAAHRTLRFGKLEGVRTESGELVGKRVPIIEYTHNDKIGDLAYRRECGLVEDVAQVIASGKLTAVTSVEVLLEFVGLPKTFPGTGGMLYGAEYEFIPTPVSFDLQLTSKREDLRHRLEAITDPRYCEIRKQVGAFQGRKKVRLNQLFDALMLWTAETAGCEYFLTVEKKLLRYQFRSQSLICVNPSGLLARMSVDVPPVVGD